MTLFIVRVNGSVSTVDYIPRTPLDYGSLLCWASNEVGPQSQPCVFHIIPTSIKTLYQHENLLLHYKT